MACSDRMLKPLPHARRQFLLGSIALLLWIARGDNRAFESLPSISDETKAVFWLSVHLGETPRINEPLHRRHPPESTRSLCFSAARTRPFVSELNEPRWRNLQRVDRSVGNPGQDKAETMPDFDGDAAYEFLKAIVEIGPRVSASEGMRRQIQFLSEHFKDLKAQIYEQHFEARDPSTGAMVQLTNLFVRWHPDRKKRLLFCCHYDTRPFPDQDKQDPRGVFLGANDGASGVAVLCELGKFMHDLDGKYGIDFVFFDGEEFVYQAQRDPMFLGSTFFAQQYANRTQKWKYDFGILLDMIGDADLQIYMEGNSLKYTPRLVRSIWSVARELGVSEFIPEQKHLIRDDHLPLNEIGKIPTCNLIDFDFPNPQQGNIYWHTRNDVPENCSAASLGKVGRVVLAWTRQMQELNRLK